MCGLLLGQVAADEVAKDRARFEGVWSFSLVEVDGVKQPVSRNGVTTADADSMSLQIDPDGKAAIRRDGTATDTGRLRLDPTATPMQLDWIPMDGAPNRESALGIFKFEDELLLICRAPEGKPRPTEFKADSTLGHDVLMFRRRQEARE